jgi:endonuclease/exonuclease/phosphatase family metal-dependent hydrolase
VGGKRVLSHPLTSQASRTRTHCVVVVCVCCGEPLVRVGHLGVASAIRLGQARALVGGELGAPSLQSFGFARHT